MNCCPGKQQAAVWLGLAAAVALEGGALDHLLKVSIVRAVQISIRPSGGLIDKRPYQTLIHIIHLLLSYCHILMIIISNTNEK